MVAVMWDLAGVSEMDLTRDRALSRAFADRAASGLVIAVTRFSPDLRVRFTQFGMLDGVRVMCTSREAWELLQVEGRMGRGS